jgi:hypothetical protein
MTRNKLVDCPFCYGIDLNIQTSNQNSFVFFQVVCQHCSARGSNFGYDPKYADEIDMENEEDAIAGAIEAWNYGNRPIWAQIKNLVDVALYNTYIDIVWYIRDKLNWPEK